MIMLDTHGSGSRAGRIHTNTFSFDLNSNPKGGE
jgi:hypothetical protein